MNMRRLLPLIAAVALAGCGASRQTDETISESRSTQRDPHVFTLEDIQNAQQQNLNNVLAMIRRYRSEWLRPILVANTGRMVDPSAYIDRQRIGTVSALVNVPLASATLIRYLTPPEAQGELGLDNLGGAIVVSTR